MTRNDIITAAYRRLGVAAADDVLTADQLAYGVEVLDGVFAELGEEVGSALTWTLDTVPNKSARFLSALLAVDIAPQFSVAAPEARGLAFLRLLGSVRPDNREAPEPEYF